MIVLITNVYTANIVHLSLLVWTMQQYQKNSFKGICSYFDSLYYTIITFSTVGYGDMIPETVSEKDKVWVEKCRDGIDNYTDLDDNFGEYYKNFTEIDARKAGCKINKFVKGIAFDFESLRNNVLLKYFT